MIQRTLLACLGLVLGFAAWGIPARWKWVHPSVITAAGTGTPGVVQIAESALQSGRPGPATWLATAAIQAGLPGTNELLARIEGAINAGPALRVLGGTDPVLGRISGLRADAGTNAYALALDVFLAEENRARVRAYLEQSQAPGTRGFLNSRQMHPTRFSAVGKPGGQPLEAVLLMVSVLIESEALTPGWASELQGLAGQVGGGPADAALEAVCLDLLLLGRRLDWSSLRELARVMPGSEDLHRFTAVVRTNSDALPLLYAGATLSGTPGAVARRWASPGWPGGTSLKAAMVGGVGAVRALATAAEPVCSDGFAFRGLAPWVRGNPLTAAMARTCGLGLAAFLVAMSLCGAVGGGGQDRGSAWLWTLGMGLAIGFLLVILSEPAVPRPPEEKPRLRTASISNSGKPAAASSKRPVMEIKTIATIVLFAILQLTIYVICRRKITEIMGLSEPPAVRLRLMENEENLFDSGLYIGIAGTATALVLQVLHVVEANLLAAYSSNLLGIVTVALIKIRHVRPSKRALILEGQVAVGPEAGR